MYRSTARDDCGDIMAFLGYDGPKCGPLGLRPGEEKLGALGEGCCEITPQSTCVTES